MKNYYSILGITRDANIYEIEEAYKRLQTFTKYTGQGDDFENVRDYLELQKAYNTLINESKRYSYDLGLILDDFEIQKKQLLEDFNFEKSLFLRKIKNEKDRAFEMEEEISKLLIQIETLEMELNKLKPIEAEKHQALMEKTIVEEQNKRLLQIAKEHKNNIYKIVTVLSFSFLLIFILVYINIR